MRKITKKVILLILSMMLIGSSSIYADDLEGYDGTIYGEGWLPLYYNYIVLNKKYYDEFTMVFDYITLIDLDLDGIPELLGGTRSQMECYTTIALTIKDGKVIELKDNTNGLCGISAENGKLKNTVGVEAYLYANLYQDKTTKNYKWIGSNKFKNSVSLSLGEIYELGLKNNTLEAKSISTYKHDLEKGTSTYTFKGKKVSEGVYNQEHDKFFDNLQKIGGSSTLSLPYEMERDAILGFFNGYYPDFTLAKASIQDVLVDGKRFKIPAYIIDSTPYLKLRDIAMILKNTNAAFNIGSKGSDTIVLEKEMKYIPNGNELKSNTRNTAYATLSNQKLFYKEYIDSAKLYLIDGFNYIYPDSLPYKIGVSIEYNNKIIKIETK